MGVFSIGKVVVGSLFKKPSTLMYPVIPREWEERTRGAVTIDVDGCVLCGMCARSCPTNAIEVDRKAGTWSIERMNCVQCRGCVDNCPPNCLDMDQKYTEPGGEKIIDTYEVPKKQKPAKKDKPAGEAEAAPAEGDDEALVCNKETCVYCGLCKKECPVDAITVERKPEKIWEVDHDECIKCGACIEKCPKDSLSFGGEAEPAAAPAKEEEPAKEAKPEAPAEEPAEEAAPVAEEAPAKAPAKEAAADAAPAAEGGLVCDEDSCVYCGACAEACPADALTVEDSSWAVDKDACIECGACIDQCPAGCLSMADAAEEEAPAEAEAAEEAPAEAEAAEETPAEEPAKEEAPKREPAKASPEVEAYVEEVKVSLVKDFGLAEEIAAEKLVKAGLAAQLIAFPYMMKKAAKETAEKLK